MILVVGGCAIPPVGRHHTSDADLERRFRDHRADFEALRDEFEASEMVRVFAGGRADLHEMNLSTMKSLGLPSERAIYYEDLLQRLGLWSVMKSGHGIEFRADPGAMWNGDSYKGTWWWSRDDEPPPDIRPSLDEYRFDQNKDLTVYKAVDGQWYLYIFVNH